MHNYPFKQPNIGGIPFRMFFLKSLTIECFMTFIAIENGLWVVRFYMCLCFWLSSEHLLTYISLNLCLSFSWTSRTSWASATKVHILHMYFRTEFMERGTWIAFKVKESLKFCQEIIHDAFKKRMCGAPTSDGLDQITPTLWGWFGPNHHLGFPVWIYARTT